MNAVLVRARSLSPKMAKFVAVGASSITVNSLVLWLLHDRIPLVLASAAATEAAIIYCYVGHELWTFRAEHGGRLSLRRFRDYNGVTLVGLVITAVTLQVLVALTTLHLLVANLVAIATATVWNFTLSHRWAFRVRS